MRIGYGTFVITGSEGISQYHRLDSCQCCGSHKNQESYLVNFRYLSAVIKVNKKHSEIEWIFGENSGWEQI